MKYKRFIIPSFEFSGFRDLINVPGGEIGWKTFHDVFERDANLHANLRKALKLTTEVLHPIYEMQLFLRAMAYWIQNWQEKKILNCEKFTLTSQTASAFVRTLKYHALLREDLLAEGYDFIMTSRFQSDPLEKRFGQFQQMSGGRFLVGLREATSSGKIIKLKTLLKNDISISNIMDSNVEHDENVETLLHHVDLSCRSDKMVTLSEDSRQVGIYIAGYVAKN